MNTKTTSLNTSDEETWLGWGVARKEMSCTRDVFCRRKIVFQESIQWVWWSWWFREACKLLCLSGKLRRWQLGNVMTKGMLPLSSLAAITRQLQDKDISQLLSLISTCCSSIPRHFTGVSDFASPSKFLCLCYALLITVVRLGLSCRQLLVLRTAPSTHDH